MSNSLNLNFEKNLIAEGYDLIVGIDEAGRGPWAGPVAVAAYMIHKESVEINGIYDSKKVSKNNRKKLYTSLCSDENCFKCTLASHLKIDEVGVGKTIHASILDLVQHVHSQNPRKRIKFLIDGYFKLSMDADYEYIKKGDSQIYAIAAASIIAKETRDLIMIDYSKQYPKYGFEKNVGYGTREHRQAITEYGICPIHRQSYKPIRNLISTS